MAVESVRQGTVSKDIQELAAALLAKQREPIKTLQTRQTALSQRSSVLGTLKTRLLALRAELDGLAGTGTLSPFAAKAVTSSDSNVLTATATANATSATLSVTVSQLAKRATHVSNLYTDTGTAISTNGTGIPGTGAGLFAFGVTIAGTTYNATVTVGIGDTDKTVLDNVVSAINTAIGTKGSAVRLAPETGKSRVSLSSATTGTSNKITFTDTGGLLARIGIYKATPTAATDTNGGYLYEDLGAHELDARLVVDGLTYYRESNTVSDLITGVTFNLKGTSASAVTIKIQSDGDKALQKVKDFIAKYNDVLDYLGQQTATDAKAGVRGTLVGDPVFSQLGAQLRVKTAARVTSQAAGTPDILAAIGLTTDRSGKLSIKDETKLRDTFTQDPTAFASLFNATDGIASTLKTFVDGYSKTTGTIASSQNQISIRINGFKTQIDRMTAVLAKKQVRLEDQLARNQAVLTRLTRQSAQIASILSVAQQ